MTVRAQPLSDSPLTQVKAASAVLRRSYSASTEPIERMTRPATSLPSPRDAGVRAEPARPSATLAGQVGWALFDWANSPFAVLIVTFVFPAYFAVAIAGDQLLGQALWGYALGASGLVVALLSAPLGAIADVGGRRKPWILGFALIGMIATALLWLASPGHASLPLALTGVAIANIAVAFSTMFSNAMLPDIVSEDRLGRLSGWAWGLGYAGGLAALAVALLAFVQPPVPLLGLDRQTAEHIRVVGPLVACWLGLFAWPLFLLTPDRPIRSVSSTGALRQGLGNLRRTLSELRTRQDLRRFLLANMLYADGLATLFALGGVYVSGVFGMSLADVVVFGLVLNLAAGLGAFAFGWVDDWLGSRRTILLALAGLILAGTAAVSVQTKPGIWITGCLLGLFVGPVQASSRSLMARLAPVDRQAEYFGLLALSSKATSFAGPTIAALVTEATDSQRMGLATILAFLIAGFVLLVVRGGDEHG